MVEEEISGMSTSNLCRTCAHADWDSKYPKCVLATDNLVGVKILTWNDSKLDCPHYEEKENV